jgi:4-amino-4-deoxy-L-arabinose transferase-like glycosyltransferase
VPSSRALRHALWVALLRVVVSLTCLYSGFRAVSDDDYSRVVIAARFAHHPSLDPSGTSWLPLPFWLYGVPMALFGDSLFVARAVAVLLGAASSVLVWSAAKVLGFSERAALWGALGAVLLPYGAWLSAAMVPEAPTAALLLFGCVSLVRPEPKLRAWGGLAMGAACFSRYESWAPALVFGLLTALDAWRTRQRVLSVAAALATLPIALWLLHGVVRHGDALFFVARVQQYRAALGGPAHGWFGALWQTPFALVRFEPELFAVTAVALGLSLRKGQSPFGPTAWRPVGALGALVLFLMIADATGGSATHHPERSLLPVFWFLSLMAAGLVARLADDHERPWRLPAFALPLALAASLLLRPDVRNTFADRREEEQVGGVLRRLDARNVVLDTDDFGFFAVQAALGYGKSRPLSEHDPRKTAEARPSTTTALAARLRHDGAEWLVTPRGRGPLAAPLGHVRLTTPRFNVVELSPHQLEAAR